MEVSLAGVDMAHWITLRRVLLLTAGASALVGCDNGNWCAYCSNSPPQEISLAVVTGNFDGNGHPSVVTTSTVQYQPSFNPGNLKVYLSTGAGAFAAPKLTAAGNDPLFLASADLNGDHLPDLVSASYDDGMLSVFLNNPATPGVFAAPVLLTSPGASQVAIGDMNGDGLPDLISADFGVSLFLQTSPGKFASPISLYGGGANWVAVGDLNGDGQPDVALADAVGVKVLFHTGPAGSTTYSAPVSVYTQSVNPGITGANLIAIADVNGDGLADLVITDPGPVGSPPTVNVLLQMSGHPGTFESPVVYQLPGNSTPESIMVADVNGDGHPDIVVGGSSAVSVLLQMSSAPGSFAAAANYAVSNAGEFALADVNGDGLVDIVVPVGVAHPVVSGVVTNNPGVLKQVAGAPGTFAPVTDLP